jgi:hypothetical protein
MAKRWFRLAAALLVFMALSFSGAWAKTEFFKTEDLRPGMKGIGKTCYQGTRPEEFQVEILGVLHGVNPGASAVLARLSGNMLERTGVFEGMSGSPVFVEGKLLGAIAFSYTFAKEAICGITPITEMIGAFDEMADPSSGVKGIFNKSMLGDSPQQLPPGRYRVKELAIAARDIGPQPLLAGFSGHTLVPIATPLSLGGFDSETLKVFAPRFRAMGMSILQGVGGAGPGTAAKSRPDSDSSPLEPGSNIVVPLVRGDLDVSAGGTVTYVDGNKLYAFGHSMFELGFTELPFHKGQTITVFPSLESSFKILETGDVAGTIRQDRGMGIYGIVGQKPRMVPLKIHLTTSRGIKRDLQYELARDPLLTPLLVNLTVYNTIAASERLQGSSTLRVKGRIAIKNEKPVEIENRFSSNGNAPSDASLSIAVPVNYLMAAGYKNLDLENIDLEITAQEVDQAAILDSIRFSRTEVKAGESLDLEISCRKANGELIRNTYPVKIPANASPGPLTMLVADGTTLMSLDDQEEGKTLIPRDLTQLIRLINNLRKNDRLYVRFFRQEPGMQVKGEGLPGLPPAFLSIMKSERKAGAAGSIRTSTILEYELPAADQLIEGAKILRLAIKP